MDVVTVNWESLEARVARSGDVDHIIECSSLTMNDANGNPAITEAREMQNTLDFR